LLSQTDYDPAHEYAQLSSLSMSAAVFSRSLIGQNFVFQNLEILALVSIVAICDY